jgi:hypothetical protein
MKPEAAELNVIAAGEVNSLSTKNVAVGSPTGEPRHVNNTPESEVIVGAPEKSAPPVNVMTTCPDSGTGSTSPAKENTGEVAVFAENFPLEVAPTATFELPAPDTQAAIADPPVIIMTPTTKRTVKIL